MKKEQAYEADCKKIVTVEIRSPYRDKEIAVGPAQDGPNIVLTESFFITWFMQ